MSFTLAFPGNIRAFSANPLTTETPFGTAFIASAGNAFAELEAYREIVQRVAEHFRDTDSPLGIDAQDALDTVWSEENER